MKPMARILPLVAPRPLCIASATEDDLADRHLKAEKP